MEEAEGQVLNSRKSHNRFDQSLSIKQASGPRKTCVSSYERNSTNTLSQQLAVSYQKSSGSDLEFILFRCKKLTPKQSHHNRSHQFLSIKQASSPGKTCASSYKKSSIYSLNQQLAVSYQFDASGNRVQISNAPAGGAAAEIGSISDRSNMILNAKLPCAPA